MVKRNWKRLKSRLLARPAARAGVAGLLTLGAVLLGGCGGGPMSQEELKRRALKRAPDVEAPPPDTPATAKAGAGAAKSAPAAARSAARGKTGAASTANASTAPDPALPQQAPAAEPRTAGRALSDTQAPPATALSPEERAKRTVANLERIGAAFQKYVEVKTVFPARAVFDRNNAPLLSWRVAILPYLGYSELYEQFHLDEPWDSKHNQTLLAKIPAVYQSPERYDERTNYLVPVSPNTTFGRNVIAWPTTIEDGPRNTVFVVEADDALAVPWTEPRDYDLNIRQPTRQLGSLRGGSFYVVWGSGTVGRILTTAPLNDLKAMFTYDGGEDFHAGKITQPLFAAGAAAAEGGAGSAGAPSPGGAGSSDALSSAESLSPLAARFLSRASDALAAGNERTASQWFYASALVSPPGGSWVERYQWVPALKRPAPILRIGVGLQYRGPRRNELEQRLAARGGRGGGTGSATWSSATGEIGKSILAALSSHLDRCAEGSLLGLANEATTGPARNRRGAPNARAARPNPRASALLRTTPGESLAPGIHFIAIADEPVLRVAARREGVEVLALVDWQDLGHKQSMRVELIDTARDVTLLQLPWIDSAAVEDALAKPLAKNPFPDFLRQLHEFLEQQLSFEPFPEQIQPRHVAGRLAVLAASQTENPLAALTEMRFYRERGLADDTQLLLAFQELIGQKEGSELLLGDAQTRERVLKPWLPVVDPAVANSTRPVIRVDED